jgi:hypothetical protein
VAQTHCQALQSLTTPAHVPTAATTQQQQQRMMLKPAIVIAADEAVE